MRLETQTLILEIERIEQLSGRDHQEFPMHLPGADALDPFWLGRNHRLIHWKSLLQIRAGRCRR